MSKAHDAKSTPSDVPKEQHKLYVVGESSPNPQDWSIWSEWALVIASSPEEAKKIADRTDSVAEVDMSKPQLIVAMSEPRYGDDL